MFTQEIIIENETGIHARPATAIVKKASAYSGSVTIKTENKNANAKSMISLLSLGLSKNDKITLIVEGENEEEAGREIAEFIQNFRD